MADDTVLLSRTIPAALAAGVVTLADPANLVARMMAAAVASAGLVLTSVYVTSRVGSPVRRRRLGPLELLEPLEPLELPEPLEPLELPEPLKPDPSVLTQLAVAVDASSVAWTNQVSQAVMNSAWSVELSVL
jgi:hypothetical protein